VGFEPFIEQFAEHPTVAGVADAVEDSSSDRDVVGLVRRPRPPRVVVVARDHDVRTVPANGPGDVAAQGEAVLDHPVGVAEELHDLDANQRRARAFFLLTQRATLLGRNAVDACLAAGGQAVHNPLALRGPAGDRCGRSVFEVIGVCDDSQCDSPGLVDGLQRRCLGGDAVGHQPEVTCRPYDPTIDLRDGAIGPDVLGIDGSALHCL